MRKKYSPERHGKDYKNYMKNHDLVKLSIRISKDKREMYRLAALANNKSLAAFIKDALDEKLGIFESDAVSGSSTILRKFLNDEKENIATKLLLNGVAEDIISYSTGLSMATIEVIRQNIL